MVSLEIVAVRLDACRVSFQPHSSWLRYERGYCGSNDHCGSDDHCGSNDRYVQGVGSLVSTAVGRLCFVFSICAPKTHRDKSA